MNDDNVIVRLSDGEIALWSDQNRAIHIKAVSAFGDPVEMTAEEAKELAAELLRLVTMVE
ncbi:MAG TPA: hypothetical protein VKP30_20575 [Polyangiaceae bacterium]|nr:hypothetical protein [Polyangiaceae bacterium]